MANDISSSVRALQPAPARDASQFVELKGSGAPDAPKPQSLPPSGQDLPEPPAKADLEDAVNRINEYVQSVQRDLSFSMDDASGHTVIQVKDRSTGDLIRQIPSAEVLAMAAYIGEQASASSSQGSALQGMLFSDST